MLKFGYEFTHPRKQKRTISKINDICQKLIKDTQQRPARLDLINKIFRRKGHRKYRFSEDRIKKLISKMGNRTNINQEKKSNLMNGSLDERDLDSIRNISVSPVFEKSPETRKFHSRKGSPLTKRANRNSHMNNFTLQTIELSDKVKIEVRKVVNILVE